jgi:ubiquinone/menaquinone biosynthesis C-methylase UbiE
MDSRAQNEIQHGVLLSESDPEWTWGWGSPAGQYRAKRRASMLINATQMNSNSKVLEIGCGTGMFTEMLSTSGANIIAVDISPQLINKAKTRTNWSTKVQFINKDFENCEIDGPFDIVLGSSILHHLKVEQSLCKIYELLKVGGVLAFAEPNMLNPQICIQKNIPIVKKWMGDSPDEIAFIRWGLASTLSKKGFKNINITPFDWVHPAIPKLFIKPVSFIGRVLERLPGVREFSGSLLISARRIE